jgi:hypothetical protein
MWVVALQLVSPSARIILILGQNTMAGKKNLTGGHFVEKTYLIWSFFPKKKSLTGISESLDGQKNARGH